MKRFRSLIILMLSLALTSVHAMAHTEKDEILVISSYNTDSKYVYDAISSFFDAYMQLHGQCSVVVEGMECTTLNESHLWVSQIKELLAKHPRTKLAVLMGPEAWVSYFSLTEQKYKELPVFCVMAQRYCAALGNQDIPAVYRPEGNGTDREDILELIKGFNVQLCYYYEYGLPEDMLLVHSLFPDTRNVAVISDNTYAGLSHHNLVKSYLHEHHPELNIISIDGRYQNMEEALQVARDLPPHTVGILCIWRFDKDKVIYMNNAEYAFKKANPGLPVFSLTGTGIGYWTVGGNVPKYRPLGNELGEKAYELMDSGKWGGPYISAYENEYRLDMEVLKKWNLLKVRRPFDAVYVNGSLTLRDMMSIYKWYFILCAGLLLTLTAGLVVSLSYSIRIRRLKLNLEKSDEQLRHEKEELEKSEKQLRIAKEEAEEASRMKSTFVSNMSHEIRTPLNAIVGFSDILVSETQDRPELKEYIDIIHHNSDILLKLVNDILDISRLEANKQGFIFEPCNIVPYCSSIISTLKNNTAQGVKLYFKSPVEELVIPIDVVRLQQVIINLIGNAAKFTKEGYIELSLHPDEDTQTLAVWVTDTGSGIPPEEQKHVFERFRKLNEHVQGTGLGLAICQMTVRRLGGEIWIDSEYTGGTRFIFTLPMRREE